MAKYHNTFSNTNYGQPTTWFIHFLFLDSTAFWIAIIKVAFVSPPPTLGDRCSQRSVLAEFTKSCVQIRVPMGTEKVQGNDFSGECFLIFSNPGVGWFFWLHEGKQDPGSPFPCIFLKYLTNHNSTQVLAISARTEQYGLFLTPIISTTPWVSPFEGLMSFYQNSNLSMHSVHWQCYLQGCCKLFNLRKLKLPMEIFN